MTPIASRLRARLAARSAGKRSVPGRRARGLRTRIALLVMAVLLAVSGAAGTVLIEMQADSAHVEMRQRAAALLETLAVPAAMALAVDDLEQLDGHLAQLSGSGGGDLGLRSVAMLDHEGRLIAHSGRALLGSESPTDKARLQGPSAPHPGFAARAARSSAPLWSRYRIDGSALMLQVSMPAVSGLRWGTLVANFDLSAVQKRIESMRRGFQVVFFVVALLIGLVLYVGVDRLVLRPLANLGGAARAVLAGDLAARAEVTREDELGAVARTFNAMASELQDYTESLEHRVAERTAEVERKNRELEELNDELARLARTDELTGLLNRRAFRKRVDNELRRSDRTGYPVSLFLVDLDYFKRINDTWGHATGDIVLRTLADVMRRSLRATDVVARFGGEEFAVLLLDTTGHDALRVAEKLRSEIAHEPHMGVDGQAIPPVTASIGVAVAGETTHGLDELLHRADVALYAAKAAGRNRVVMWTPSVSKAGLAGGAA
ncbi:MAG: diguanylate cyclase [Myxococcota bacterium]